MASLLQITCFVSCLPSFFRIGGESLAVAQNTYAVSWFKGKELNLVFGLQLSMARIVSVKLDGFYSWALRCAQHFWCFLGSFSYKWI